MQNDISANCYAEQVYDVYFADFVRVHTLYLQPWNKFGHWLELKDDKGKCAAYIRVIWYSETSS